MNKELTYCVFVGFVIFVCELMDKFLKTENK